MMDLDELAAEMARLDRELRLLDPAHLHLFTTWYALGGVQHPPTPLELMEWPAALRADFATLMRRLHDLRKRRDPTDHKPGKR